MLKLVQLVRTQAMPPAAGTTQSALRASQLEPQQQQLYFPGESDSEEETQKEKSEEQQERVFRGMKNFCCSLSHQQSPTGKSDLAMSWFLLLPTGDSAMNQVS